MSKDQVVAQVFSTNDYNKFLSLERNRDVTPVTADFRALKESISKYGILVPILCKKEGKNLRILEGHRRKLIAQILGAPLLYTLSVKEGESEIRDLVCDINNTSCKWKLSQYLRYHMDKPEYQYVDSLQKTYVTVPLSDIIYIFGENYTTTPFKKGVFVAKNRGKNRNILQCVAKTSVYELTKRRHAKKAIIQLCREEYPIHLIIQSVKELNSQSIPVGDNKIDLKNIIEQKVISLMKKGE